MYRVPNLSVCSSSVKNEILFRLSKLIRRMSAACVGKKQGLLDSKNINPNFVSMEYAVRGPLVIRALQIEKELKEGKKKAFSEVIRANIGDCHAMGQKPLTHVRQMIALGYDNSLFNSPNIPADIKERTKIVLDSCDGRSLGAYSNSAGLEAVRRQVAEYISHRDNFDSNWENIFLTAGATPAVKSILSLLNCPVDGKKPGIMIAVPYYPLYTATLAEYGMAEIPYFLDEKKSWGLDIKELKRALDEGRKKLAPRAIVIINPGNPTGQVLSRSDIEDVIKFSHKEKLVILADEVYQHNIYDPKSEFHSFKKVIMEMGPPYSQMDLVSFNSASKGYFGECGIRGGYMELVNIDQYVQDMLTKSLTASLCSTTAGQLVVSAMVNPPMEGDPSYELYVKERCGTLSSLAERAELVYKTFNSFEGFSCNIIQGAMYAFPQIKIPPKAIEAAKKAKQAPDTFYAFALLEEKGICVVSGSGFHQQPGTHHFRTTILPPTNVLKNMLEKFKVFHASFMKKYK